MATSGSFLFSARNCSRASRPVHQGNADVSASVRARASHCESQCVFREQLLDRNGRSMFIMLSRGFVQPFSQSTQHKVRRNYGATTHDTPNAPQARGRTTLPHTHDGLQVADHRGKGVGPDRRADDVVRCRNVCHPVAHGLIDGILQRP